MDRLVTEIMRQNKELLQTHDLEFRILFGVGLSKYMELLTGFNVIKFGEEIIQPPDGVSIMDEMVRRYGEGAVVLIGNLIGGRSE